MRPLLLLSALLVGCAPLPPKPDLGPSVTLSVQRDSLPATSLRLLRVATTNAPADLVIQGSKRRPMQLPVYVYVLEHPTAGVVLIDAGFARRTAVDPGEYPGGSMTRTLGLEMEQGMAAADRLPEAGIAPEDVAHIFLTHLHPDHVGGIEDFPGATVHVASSEWAARDDGGPLGKPDPSPWANAKVEEITLIEQPHGPFAAHADVLGDGSLVALSTPGHTPGHLSYLLHLSEGSYLFTGDTAWVDEHWRAPALKSNLVRTLLEHDWETNWDSQWRLHDFGWAQPHLTVLSGHDEANETRLPAWPEAVR